MNKPNVLGALFVSVLFWTAAMLPDSPVADAAMRGDVETVRSLLKDGADVNAAQGDGMTALHWAAERGSVAPCQDSNLGSGIGNPVLLGDTRFSTISPRRRCIQGDWRGLQGTR